MKHFSVVNASVTCLSLFMLVGCGGGAAIVPTSYSSYNAKDGSFACDTPDGWDIKGGGRSGTPVWAKFASGSALIHFKASSTNRLANAALSGRSPAANEIPSLAPVELLHVDAIKQAEQDFDGYTEIAGPTVMNCDLGPARMSEFNYTTSFGSNMHGYRISIIGYDRGVNVFCICTEGEWKSVKPVFDKVLASIVRGEEES